MYIFQGSCLNGDNPYYTVNGMNCSAAAASQSWVCYDTAIHDNCCGSCPLFNNGITGILYITWLFKKYVFSCKHTIYTSSIPFCRLWIWRQEFNLWRGKLSVLWRSFPWRSMLLHVQPSNKCFPHHNSNIHTYNYNYFKRSFLYRFYFNRSNAFKPF